jgi:hypothetical protein
MLQVEIVFVEMGAEAQPFFETSGGFDDVHAGNDSDGWKKKSNYDLPASRLLKELFASDCRLTLKRQKAATEKVFATSRQRVDRDAVLSPRGLCYRSPIAKFSVFSQESLVASMLLEDCSWRRIPAESTENIGYGSIMQMAITFLAVVGGMIFSLAIALLTEELIFGQVFRLFFSRRTTAIKTEAKR